MSEKLTQVSQRLPKCWIC